MSKQKKQHDIEVEQDNFQQENPADKYLKQIFPIFKEELNVHNYSSLTFYVDIYRVLDAFPTGSAAIDHALKKLLVPGKRGRKGYVQDLKEAMWSIQQEIELEKQRSLFK